MSNALLSSWYGHPSTFFRIPKIPRLLQNCVQKVNNITLHFVTKDWQEGNIRATKNIAKNLKENITTKFCEMLTNIQTNISLHKVFAPHKKVQNWYLTFEHTTNVCDVRITVGI